MQNMQEKFNELSLGEKLVSIGGLVMLIGSFFDWYHYDAGVFGSIGQSGWDAPGSIWSVLAILVSIVLAGIVVAVKFGNVTMPALPEGVTWGMVYGGGAAAVVVLMLLKAWRISDVPIGGFGLGFWIGAIAAILIAAGGYMLYSQEKAGS